MIWDREQVSVYDRNELGVMRSGSDFLLVVWHTFSSARLVERPLIMNERGIISH